MDSEIGEDGLRGGLGSGPADDEAAGGGIEHDGARSAMQNPPRVSQPLIDSQ